MVSKTTGIFLLGLMAMVIGLKHPSLKYCLCMESLTLVEQGCCVEVEQEASCCGVPKQASCSAAADEDACGENDLCALPDGEDCEVDLVFDLGDYVGSEKPVELEKHETIELIVSAELPTFALREHAGVGGIRAGPEPPPIAVPLYVRHSVYLL
jgi:hypothetical protein